MSTLLLLGENGSETRVKNKQEPERMLCHTKILLPGYGGEGLDAIFFLSRLAPYVCTICYHFVI